MLFIYTSYTANIVALLQSSSTAIKTLEDLLSSSMEFGVEDTPYNRFWFPAQTEHTRKRIFMQKIAPPNQPDRFMNISYGISRIRQGLFAFHSELSSGYQIMEETFYEHEKCGLKEIDYLNFVSPWFVMSKNSPYKEVIKITYVKHRYGVRLSSVSNDYNAYHFRLFKMREHGLQARVQAQIYSKKPTCHSNSQNFESVRIIDCYAALLLLAYGFAASFMLLIVEILVVKGDFRTNPCQI